MSREEAIKRLKLTDACDVDLCEALDMAIKALEQEPCEDAISREETLKALMDEWTEYDRELIGWLFEKIDKLPSVTPQPCDDAISRQAVLEAFGLSEKSRKYGGDHSGYDTLMKYEIQDILEDLPSVTAQQKMDSSSENPNKWIPVSERLPEVGSEVLVCYEFKKHRSVYIADFYGDGKFHGLDDEYLTTEGRKYRKAVAWMPLPQPYQSEIPTGAEGSDKE